MNKAFDKYKEEQIQSTFFILRVLTLLFCASPVFQSIFGGLTADEALDLNLFAVAVALSVLSVVIVIWFVID